MKWTKNKRFPNDKVGIIKDEISDKVKGVGAHLEGFITDESRGENSKDSERRGRVDTVGSEHLPKEVVIDTDKVNHGTEQEESTMLDKEIILTPESIGESIVSQAIANTSTSEYTPLETGSLQLEKNSYYSHFFSLTPLLVTNRGCIQVRGKNFDYIQIIQRN
jgi:hypothetical protein